MDLLQRRREMMAQGAGPLIPYQQVEWLGSDSTSNYILIQKAGNTNIFDFEIRLRFKSVPSSGYRGSGCTTNYGIQSFVGINANSSTGVYMCFAQNSTNTIVKQLVNSDKTGWHTYRAVSDGTTCIYYVDGAEVLRHNKPFTIGQFGLFGMSGQSGTAGTGIGNQEIGHCSLSVGNRPFLDLYPVRDGQTGYFYDTVEGQLYGIASSATPLIIGPDI